jgi:hypothetical protein
LKISIYFFASNLLIFSFSYEQDWYIFVLVLTVSYAAFLQSLMLFVFPLQ